MSPLRTKKSKLMNREENSEIDPHINIHFLKNITMAIQQKKKKKLNKWSW